MADTSSNTFAIAFDTNEMAPLIKAITVTMGVTVMRERDSANINLCDHKDYLALFKYCLANPPKGYRVKQTKPQT